MVYKKLNPQRSPWLLCWAVYSSAYFGRVNLSIALPFLSASGGYPKVSLGLIALGFFAAYAGGQLVNGILGDRFNPRWFAGIGLAAAGLSNILFGLSGSLPLMLLLWTLNGYFQSMLWGPLIRLVSEHSPPEVLHRGILFLASSPIIGYSLSYALVGRLTLFAGWRALFFVPGMLLILMAGGWIWALRGIRPENGGAENQAAGPSRVPERFLRFLRRTRLWAAALVCIMAGIIKEGLSLWGPSFLAEAQSISMDRVLFIMSLAPLMNLPVLVLSGWVHRFFQHREKYTLLIFSTVSLFCTVLLRLTLGRGAVFAGLAFSGMLAALFAIISIQTSFVPLNFFREQRVSAAAGFLDCAVYLGAAVSGPLIGFMADTKSWELVSDCWIGIAALTIPLCLIPLRRRS